MLKITQKQVSYSEISQPNPLRWTILYREETGDFVNQTNQMKCRDFFNDVVAFKQTGKKFGIYGFSNDLKFNDGGLYLLLDNIADMARFKANLEVVQQKSGEDLSYYPMIEGVQTGAGQLILYIPEIFWTKTFYISLLTLLIRGCNYDMQYEGWDDFFKDTSPLLTVDGAISGSSNKRYVEYIHANGFVLPNEVRGFWQYASKDLADKVDRPLTVHNNGVVGWLYAVLEGI